MNKAFLQKIFELHQSCDRCPSPQVVAEFFNDLLGSLFPDYTQHAYRNVKELEMHLEKLQLSLEELLYFNIGPERDHAEALANHFFNALPNVHDLLEGDIQAMFEGDPAARSKHEIIRSYPGFFAIAAYRLAHALHDLGVKTIPRILTEHAHGKTGIDIHPGAEIGPNFCIDHGTGVVIGETCIIGSHVKIYQGVTLGALSVDKVDADSKRHPTIEDHVVIYAGATILGGETTIGHHSVIGGNVWLTRSIPPNSKVYYQAQMNMGDSGISDMMVFKQYK